MSERLFRDDGGAALERVAALEDENRRLRAEIERLANGEPEPGRDGMTSVPVPNGRSAVVGMVTASLAVLFASMLSVFSGRHVHHEHAHVRLPDAMNPAIAVAGTTATALPAVIEVTPRTATTRRADCTYIDENGFKHYRRECLREPTGKAVDRHDPWATPDVSVDPFTKPKP